MGRNRSNERITAARKTTKLPSSKNRPRIATANVPARTKNQIDRRNERKGKRAFVSLASGPKKKSAAAGSQTSAKIDQHQTDLRGRLRGVHYKSASDYYFTLFNKHQSESSHYSIAQLESASINTNFCRTLRDQIKLPNLKRSAFECELWIKAEARRINRLIIASPSSSIVHTMSSGQNQPISGCCEDETTWPVIPLIPPSQWVYSTPDKQNVRNFTTENLDTNYLPAVFLTSKKSRVLYDIKNEYVKHVDLNKCKGGEKVPIDKRFLNTICENMNEEGRSGKKRKNEEDKENVFDFRPAKEVVKKQPSADREFNLFLSGNAEETVNIEEMMEKKANDSDNYYNYPGKFNFEQCRSALPLDDSFLHSKVRLEEKKMIPKDYQHQLLLATERPSKLGRRIQKRHLLKTKRLSFDETSPSTKPKPRLLHKTTNDMEEYRSSKFTPPVSSTFIFSAQKEVPHTLTSGTSHTLTSGALLNELEAGVTSKMDTDDSTLPSFKYFSLLPGHKSYFPRRNFDPE